jgi:hypothetical protein
MYTEPSSRQAIGPVPVAILLLSLGGIAAGTAAAAVEPFVINDFGKAFDVSYQAWQDKVTVADGHAVLKGLKCSGGGGVNGALNLSAYAGGVKPLAVYRKTVPTNAQLPGGIYPTRHRLYLKLPSALAAGKTHAVRTEAINLRNPRLHDGAREQPRQEPAAARRAFFRTAGSGRNHRVRQRRHLEFPGQLLGHHPAVREQTREPLAGRLRLAPAGGVLRRLAARIDE